MRIAAALLVLVLLLAGCANASPIASETSPTAPDPSDPSGIPDVTVPPLEAPFLEDPLWQLPRGQEYYFLFSPRESQYNLNENFGIIFITIPLISRKEIDLDQFRLTIPLKTIPYTVEAERVLLPIDEFRHHLFRCYQDVDWSEYRQGWWIEWQQEHGAALNEADQARLEAYYAKDQELFGAYEALTPDTLPGSLSSFYAYKITIRLSIEEQPKEESFSYMDVSWPGVSFRQDCGDISFVRKPIIGMGDFYSLMEKKMFFGVSNGASLDYRRFQGIMQWAPVFTPAKDITLESVSFPDGNGTFLKAFLTMTQKDGTSMELTWDGKTPLPVQAGTEVTLWIYFTDPRCAHLVPTGENWCRLNFSCEGKSYWGGYGGSRDCTDYDYYALAAIYFDGVDVPAYYREFESYRPLWVL